MTGCVTTQRDGITEQRGLLTTKYTYSEDDVNGEIVISNLYRTADVNLNMYVEETGQNELAVNMVCSLLIFAFMQNESLAAMETQGSLEKESGESGLEGVQVQSVKLVFYDKKDRSKVAECMKQKDKDPEFHWYK
jgi:hypothetical protein